MAPEQLAEAERLIRSGAGLDAACAAVCVCKRTLERAWMSKHGTTPARWRREVAPLDSATSPVVAFRLPEHADLVAAASADGVEPNAWAREAVRRALAHVKKK